ncbi:MAG: sugar kinase [Alkalispirochaeta sp.]
MGYTVTFGEIMTRHRMPGHRRIRQALPGLVDVTFSGAESNVAALLSMLGTPVRFVTALPRNPMADACMAFLKGFDLDLSQIVRTDQGRLGAYYIEMGASQRPCRVFYDREGSAIAHCEPEAYDWDAIFHGADRLHLTGITPALSAAAARSAITAVTRARAAGLTVSCDLNFRSTLWNWEPGTDPRQLARRTMSEILPHVHLLIANEEDAHDVLGIGSGSTRFDRGVLDIDHYPSVAQQIAAQFPNIDEIAITLRESISASHNRWGAMHYDTHSTDVTFAPLQDGVYSPYEITPIVDRVGAGDSFGAALIFAGLDPELQVSTATRMAFATAASALCHTIDGDFDLITRDEVQELMNGNGAGRVRR